MLLGQQRTPDHSGGELNADMVLFEGAMRTLAAKEIGNLEHEARLTISTSTATCF